MMISSLSLVGNSPPRQQTLLHASSRRIGIHKADGLQDATDKTFLCLCLELEAVSKVEFRV